MSTETITSKHPFYYGTIKQIVGGFGALFSNMIIERRLFDSVKGEVAQTIKVPISYGPHEKWLTMLNADPSKAKQVNTVLPRMAYEITGFSYDTTRKATRSSTIRCVTSNGDGTATGTTVLSPAPWNIDMSLYIMGNKTEDVLQITEQILPYFNPDYSITLKSIPEMNVSTTVPITLNGVSIQDDYTGDAISQRLIVYTLSFSAKANLFGAQSVSAAITTTDVEFPGFGFKTVVDTVLDEDGSTIFTGTASTTKHTNELEPMDDSLITKDTDINYSAGTRTDEGKVITKVVSKHT